MALAALAYGLFVVYGSLVPLAYRPLPWAEALQRFTELPWLNLGVGSRADWVANVLLFIPLSFLWLGVLWHRFSLGLRLAASLGVWIGALLLSATVEFVQLWFPPRTTSLNDIAAEALGAAIGIVLWWSAGPRLVQRIRLLWQAHAPREFGERLLVVYLVGLVFYNLLPLDLTLSPVELFHKWREGRIHLLPFAGLPSDPAEVLYALAADVALWVPIGWLWARYGIVRATLRVAAGAVLVELLQLFVWSRVSDPGDVLTAAVGGTLGAAAARWRGAAPSLRAHAGLLASGWAAVILAVFWYPYDFSAQEVRLTDLARVPFAAYYFGTEYRAATEVLHKLLFFLPLGALLALRLRKAVALLLAAALALVVEGGQLFLPGKHADLTDWVIELSGAALGAWAAGRMGSASARGELKVGWPLMAVWLALALVLYGLARLPAVPYNVRESIDPTMPWISALGLAASLLWAFAYPVWAVARQRSLLAALLVHGVVAYALLRLSVPLESLDDVVGTPVLGWPWEWERLGRFLALFLAFGLAAWGAALWTAPAASFRARLVWFAVLVPGLALSHAVVVKLAATDNLTELIAGEGSPFAFLALWLALLALFTAGYAAVFAQGIHRLWPAPVSLLLGWGLAQLGLESRVVKYGETFSALQFLLSSDRAHYAGPWSLAWRFALAWAGLFALSAGAASSVRRWARAQRDATASGPRQKPPRDRARPGQSSRPDR